MKKQDAERRAQIKKQARELVALATECRVTMLRACRRIRMATSTPHRWLTIGSEPAPGQLKSLRAAVLRIAQQNGTLPDKYRREFNALEPEPAQRTPKEIAADLARGVAELQQSLAAGS